MSENKVPAALAKTTFFSGDKINPAPMDAYTAARNGVYNKIEDLAGKFGLDIGGLARGTAFVKQNLPAIKSLIKTGKALANAGSLAGRLDAATSLFKAGTPLLASALPAGLAKTITDGFNNNAGTIAKLGDLAKKVEGIDLHNMKQVGSLLGDMTGAKGPFGVIDAQSTIGVMSGIAINACQNGIPGAITTVLNSTQARDMAQAAMKQIVPAITALGKVDYLKEVADFGKSKGIDLAGTAKFDNFVQTFQAGTVQDKAEGQFAKFVEAGKDLDPGFGIMEMNGATVTKTWEPDEMSDDAYQCLKTDVVTEKISAEYAATITRVPEPPEEIGSFFGSSASYSMPMSTTTTEEIGSFFGSGASYSMPMFTTTTEDGLTGQKKV